MKRWLPFFLILLLSGVLTLTWGWKTPDLLANGYFAERPQWKLQSHEDEDSDDADSEDGDGEEEDDDYDLR